MNQIQQINCRVKIKKYQQIYTFVIPCSSLVLTEPSRKTSSIISTDSLTAASLTLLLPPCSHDCWWCDQPRGCVVTKPLLCWSHLYRFGCCFWDRCRFGYGRRSGVKMDGFPHLSQWCLRGVSGYAAAFCHGSGSQSSNPTVAAFVVVWGCGSTLETLHYGASIVCGVRVPLDLKGLKMLAVICRRDCWYVNLVF